MKTEIYKDENVTIEGDYIDDDEMHNAKSYEHITITTQFRKYTISGCGQCSDIMVHNDALPITE